jgi:hypothetical protein
VTAREKLLRIVEDLPEPVAERTLRLVENELASAASAPLNIPEEWKTFDDGTPQPDWESLVRQSRDSH